MRSIIVSAFGGPEVLRLADVPAPTPGPDEVLVRVRAAGVNPVESYIRSGNYARLPGLPYTPGLEGAGDVVDVGAEVSSFRAGERVYWLGAPSYCELAVVRAEDLHSLPPDVSYEQGAAIGLAYVTAHRSLFSVGGARRGEWLLVHGASGGVGTAALQLACSAGMKVAGTAGSPGGLQHVADQGALAFEHGDLQGLMSATGDKGFDLILELAAHLHLGADLDLLAFGGRVVVAGSRGPVEVNPRSLMLRDASIRGMMYQHSPPEEAAEIFQDIGRGLADGSLQPVVGRRFPLSEAPLAHAALFEPGARGKIVLIP